MNAFQLLKSGASFNRPKIAQVDQLFKKPATSTSSTKPKSTKKAVVVEPESEAERNLSELDAKME